MTTDVEHVVEVVTDEDGYRYRAECSCGWASDWLPYDDEAEWAAEDHREVAIDPEPAGRPEGFDRFMSGLLDVQDDLLAASMWLAEHWSADLPVPGWFSNGDDHDDKRPAFQVRVYCLNARELTRAAEALDVAVVDDPAPDGCGNRYRRAIRRFGRVEVEAFTSLATTCTECGAEFTGGHCPGCYDPAHAGRTLRFASELVTAEAGL